MSIPSKVSSSSTLLSKAIYKSSSLQAKIISLSRSLTDTTSIIKSRLKNFLPTSLNKEKENPKEEPYDLVLYGSTRRKFRNRRAHKRIVDREENGDTIAMEGHEEIDIYEPTFRIFE
jgi:hypothetical protein